MGAEKEVVKTKGRHCTDVFFLILLLACWAGMSAVSYVAVRDGNLDRLKYGYDSEGNLCGSPKGVDSKRDLSDKPHLYYFDMSNRTSYKMCVNSCPKATFETICKYDHVQGNAVNQILPLGSNCTYTAKSTSVMYRCVPDVVVSALNSTINGNTESNKLASIFIDDLNARSVATKIYQDVVRYWTVILGCAGIAFGISFVWLIIIQFLGGLFVWITLFTSLASTVGVAVYMLYNYYLVYVKGQSMISSRISQVDTLVYNEKLLLTLGIIAAVVAFILFLLIFALFKRIKLAVVIVEEASKATRTMPTVPLFSIIKYVGLLGVMAWFTFMFALLATSGEAIAMRVEAKINQTSVETTGKQVQINNMLEYLQVYYVFGFLWTYNWVVAIGQTAVAGAVASWYWSHEKRVFRPMAIFSSLYRTLRYHMGSMAFGSLILTFVQFIRYILANLQARAKRANQGNVVQCIFCCIQCFLKCVEGLIKFMNRNAFIMISVTGKSYCASAKRAYHLIVTNGIRIFVLHRVASFLIFLGKITILFGTTIIGIALLSRADGIAANSAETVASNWAVPLFFIILFSWIIATSTLSIFDMAIDTIFLCFCEDSEENDGSAENPYYMSDALRQFVSKKDSKPEMQKK